MKDKIFIMK